MFLLEAFKSPVNALLCLWHTMRHLQRSDAGHSPCTSPCLAPACVLVPVKPHLGAGGAVPATALLKWLMFLHYVQRIH